jgi:ABC-type transport system involved in cytochrome bd biosynthesis fused ATPase/permease subunit
MDQVMEAHKQRYMMLTHSLNQYSQLSGANTLIDDTNSRELEKLARAHADLGTALQKSKQRVIAAERDERMLAKVYTPLAMVVAVLFSVVVLVSLAASRGQVPPRAAVVVSVVGLGVFAAFAFLLTRRSVV